MKCTSQVNRISFARILVEVYITRPSPKVIKIHDHKEKVIEQQLWCEWNPIFFQKCLQVGHSCVEKPDALIQKKEVNQGKKKEWIPVNKGYKEKINDIG